MCFCGLLFRWIWAGRGEGTQWGERQQLGGWGCYFQYAGSTLSFVGSLGSAMGRCTFFHCSCFRSQFAHSKVYTVASVYSFHSHKGRRNRGARQQETETSSCLPRLFCCRPCASGLLPFGKKTLTVIATLSSPVCVCCAAVAAMTPPRVWDCAPKLVVR